MDHLSLTTLLQVHSRNKHRQNDPGRKGKTFRLTSIIRFIQITSLFIIKCFELFRFSPDGILIVGRDGRN